MNIFEFVSVISKLFAKFFVVCSVVTLGFAGCTAEPKVDRASVEEGSIDPGQTTESAADKKNATTENSQSTKDTEDSGNSKDTEKQVDKAKEENGKPEVLPKTKSEMNPINPISEANPGAKTNPNTPQSKENSVVGGSAILKQSEFAEMRKTCGSEINTSGGSGGGGFVSACMQSSFLLLALDRKKEAAEGFQKACSSQSNFKTEFCGKLQSLDVANFRGCYEAAQIYKELGESGETRSADDLVTARRLATCACDAKIEKACEMLTKFQ